MWTAYRRSPYSNFYPRTPVECDLTHNSFLSVSHDFYPRTPVECDALNSSCPVFQYSISIHALLWSATARGTDGFAFIKISIHALLWSATLFLRAHA